MVKAERASVNVEEHVILYGVLGIVGTALLGFLMKVLFEWINRNKDDKEAQRIYMCPLDTSGSTQIISNVSAVVNKMEGELTQVHGDLQRGIKVAEDNNIRYLDLGMTMNRVELMMQTNLKFQERELAQMEKQTGILIEIKAGLNAQ